MNNKLLNYDHVNKECKTFLICIPYAGGNANTYIKMLDYLPKSIGLITVDLPGRGYKLSQSPYTDIGCLANDLANEIKVLPWKSYIIIGHSLGAKIGFETLKVLSDMNARMPKYFISSACRAPCVKSNFNEIHHLPDDNFKEELGKMGGTPNVILQNKELMNLLLPALKADFKMAETHYDAVHKKLSCPIVVFYADNDLRVSASDLGSWEHYSAEQLKYVIFEGDHFYIENKQLDISVAINHLYNLA